MTTTNEMAQAAAVAEEIRGLAWEEVVARVRAAVEASRLHVYEDEMQLDLETLTRRLELDVFPREWDQPTDDTFARIKLYYSRENALAADEMCALSGDVPDAIVIQVEYVIASPEAAACVDDFATRVEERFARLARFLPRGTCVDITMRTDFDRHEPAGAIARDVVLTASRTPRFDTSFVARIAEALRAMGPWVTEAEAERP